jgi:N-acetyl-alpha-D-muramate 1-phosphate uridylyltransferase
MNLFPVVILAGGLATRIRPLTNTLPKSLIDINNEPFIAHQLRLLKKQGITQVVICLGFLGEQIIEYVGNGEKFGLSISYCFDGPTLLGTAGAIKKALPFVQDNFFVLNGDSYLMCDYQAVQQAFISKGKLGLMTVFENAGKWDTSNVEYVDQTILVYDKKNRNPNMRHIDYGLEVFSKQVFSALSDTEACDMTTIFQDLLQRKQLAAFEVKERFYEIGSFAGIEELRYYLKNVPFA